MATYPSKLHAKSTIIRDKLLQNLFETASLTEWIEFVQRMSFSSGQEWRFFAAVTRARMACVLGDPRGYQYPLFVRIEPSGAYGRRTEWAWFVQALYICHPKAMLMDTVCTYVLMTSSK